MAGPVQPRKLVVLTISVVVASLASADFVSRKEHGCPLGEDETAEKVLYLLIADFFDGSVLSWPFVAIVKAAVVVGAVSVVFSVFFVVLAVVGNQVVHGKTVMAGNKVYGVIGLSAVVTVEVGTSTNTGGTGCSKIVVSTPESAAIISESVVPFCPAATGEASYLISSTCVPSFCNNLCLS